MARFSFFFSSPYVRHHQARGGSRAVSSGPALLRAGPALLSPALLPVVPKYLRYIDCLPKCFVVHPPLRNALLPSKQFTIAYYVYTSTPTIRAILGHGRGPPGQPPPVARQASPSAFAGAVATDMNQKRRTPSGAPSSTIAKPSCRNWREKLVVARWLPAQRLLGMEGST